MVYINRMKVRLVKSGALHAAMIYLVLATFFKNVLPSATVTDELQHSETLLSLSF